MSSDSDDNEHGESCACSWCANMRRFTAALAALPGPFRPWFMRSPRWVSPYKRQRCGATDGAGLEAEPFGRCTLDAGHETGGWHQEWRGDRLWAEWRGPAPGERCSICGKGGSEH